MSELRDYQQTALDDLWGYFAAEEGNPVCVLPTGAGKSHVIAELVKKALAYPGVRVLMVTHQKELIEQNAQKILLHWPDAPMTIWAASMGQRSAAGRVVCASIQSIYKRGQDELGIFDLVIVDECHLVSNKQEGMYRKLLDRCKAVNPSLRIIGFTATVFRTGHGDLTKPGVDAPTPIFDSVAHETKMRDLIDWGYLAPLRSKRTAFQIDTSSVPIRRGDFHQGELQRMIDRASITDAALDEVQRYADGRHSWLCFCSGVAHANHVAQVMLERDIDAYPLTGNTPADLRAEVIEDFRAGDLRCITNAALLTTGFDAPGTDLIIMLAPTMSAVRYVQMMGRGMRPADGKKDCLILDFAGNISRLGPVDQIRPWTPRMTRADAPVKACPTCQEIVGMSTVECPDCGYIWTDAIRQPPDMMGRHTTTAGDDEPLSDNKPPEELTVDSVDYYLHRKRNAPDAPPTLRVEYRCGFSVFKEWVTIEHTHGARRRACEWWAIRCPGLAPSTVADALLFTDDLKVPKKIKVDTSGRYTSVVSYVM
tara:strand:+ start:9757 stop:11367 length:1611 start_codon:yes stop_codon:yes gene_type:complete